MSHHRVARALALPGIDANDLGKTQYTLNFIESVAYSIPCSPAGREGRRDPRHPPWPWAGCRARWRGWSARGQDVKINYEEELSEEDEANILRSSTAGLGEFVLALLGKVFTLLENLPGLVAPTLRVARRQRDQHAPGRLDALVCLALAGALRPGPREAGHLRVVARRPSGRDAMAWICNAMCKVNPEKTLKKFMPPSLIVNIRNEIDYNGAASERSSGSEVLPRDRSSGLARQHAEHVCGSRRLRGIEVQAGPLRHRSVHAAEVPRPADHPHIQLHPPSTAEPYPHVSRGHRSLRACGL